MSLSADLISQFVKTTNDSESKERNNIVYGTVVSVGDEKFVLLDGNDEASGQLTPISTVTDLVVGDRVCVEINNHTAMVSGNMTAPIKRSNLGEGGNLKIDNLIAGRIDTDRLVAASGEFRNIRSKYAEIQNLDVENLTAKYADIDTLKAKTAFITNLEGGSIQFDCASFDEATFKSFFAQSGIIEYLDVSGVTVSKELVGVTIKGDLIEGGTIVADKLIIRTQDGLLYKLNAEALGDKGLAQIEDKTTLQNGLHGAIINDKTIVANKINVSDLVAFGATIAGFNIKKDTASDGKPGRLYSGSKGSIDSDATPGVYLDDTGQINIGDANEYIKFYKKDDGTAKLEIAADEITLGSSKQKVLETLNSISDKALSGVDVEYYSSTSSTSLVDGSWQSDAPTWIDGRYIWSRTKVTDANGNVTYTDHVCITGNTGAAGKDGTDGINGTNGTDGRSIGRIENYYMVSNQDSGITNMDQLFGTEIPTMTSTNRYLWNYEEIFDTTNSLIARTDARIIGVYGDTGDAGKDGVDGINGTNGTDGKDGTDGKGISSIAEHYQVTSTTATPASWVSTVPTLTSTNKYLWNYETITYTDGTSTDSKKRIIGVYGDTGDAGKNGVDGAPGEQGIGVSSIIEQYYLSTSEVELTGGDWTNEQPTWSSGSYIWTRSFIIWSDDTTSTTTPVLAQAINEANANAEQASQDADKANDAADDAREVANSAYSEISKLNDAIKNLVVGKDGSTLMTQTADGWQFNFGNFKDTIDDIGKKTAYVHIDETNTGNPKIELGKTDNKAKLTLTNEDIQFVVGSEVPTKVTNEGLDTDKIKVDNEIAMGNFVWKNRANGNLGLSWKGAGS